MQAEVAVIGAGIWGLEIALACADAGLDVAVVDAMMPGAGASGGPVGALVPHQPDPWRPMKAFQLAALAGLPAHMAALLARTGHDPGYEQVGRVVPLATEAARTRAEAQAAASAVWGPAGRLNCQSGDAWPGWLTPPAGGVMACTLSARVTPWRYLTAVTAALPPQGRVPWRCHSVAPGRAICDQGEVRADWLVIAAGADSFGLAAQPGGAVKGQAALLAPVRPVPPGAPLIAGDGLYIVPHDGLVAVGSTHETTWDLPGPDGALDALVARAQALCPALVGAERRAAWAGLRPRARRGQPLIGPLPGAPRVLVATGGYKIGLGLAHLVGAAVAAMITGTAPRHPLPPGLAPDPGAGG